LEHELSIKSFKMLDCPKGVPLIREKEKDSSCTELMQCSTGISLSIICLCIYRAAASCRQVKSVCYCCK